MAEALRNLQIFRNGALLIGSIESIKGQIETAISAGTLKVNDGEPISIRYRENTEATEVKGLYGVVYGNGTTAKVLWNDSAITIETSPLAGEYVTLHHTEDENGNVLLTVAAHTSTLEKAGTIVYINKNDGSEISVEAYNNLTEAEKANYAASKADGLATAQDVKDYVSDLYVGSDAIEIEDKDGKKVIAVKKKADDTNILQITPDGLFVPNAGATIKNVQAVDLQEKTGTVKFSIDKTTDKWVVKEDESGTIAVEGGHKYLVIITSDSQTFWVLNDDSVQDTYVKSGILTTKQVEEEGKTVTKTVIRMSYNGGHDPNYFDVDVTDLVNTSHTKIDGEDEVLNEPEYVSVNATPDETTNTYTLTSTVKTVNVADARATDTDVWTYNAETPISSFAKDTTAIAPIGDVTDGWTPTITVDGHELYVLDTDEKVTAAKNALKGGSTFEAATKTTLKANNGLAVAADVKDYVDGIAHTTVSAADETIVVTETEVDGHKNYALNAEQSVINNNADDTMTVAKEGVLNQATLTKIETYIDNYDCGTFDLNTTTVTDAESLLNEASTGTHTTVELANDTALDANQTVTFN